MLIDALEGLRRRVRFFSVAYGAGSCSRRRWGCCWAIVLLDFALNLSRGRGRRHARRGWRPGVRRRSRWVVRPAHAKLSISDVAGRLESVFPQFDDRLRSTVDFVREGGRASRAPSPMKHKTVAEAAGSAPKASTSRRSSTPAPRGTPAGRAAASLALLLVLGFLSRALT